ncbi:MAG TPA: long-chain fatty acid--CoA ligase [Candidatus Saccharimonadales bacterium]|nr:long-chain fatty acid--CoA ligase [Candidatus Saccharimonadales bacterium]
MLVRWTPAGARGLDSRAVLEGVERLCLAWRGLGLQGGERVAILSENRPEWVLTDYALLASGVVPVPIYTSLTPPQIEYILSNSGAVGIVVSTPELLGRLMEVRHRLPDLKHVILVDSAGREDPGVIPWNDLMGRGRELKLRDPDAFTRLARTAGAGDLATIIYTSGTTGEPKGVMLTHGNLVSNVLGIQEVLRFTPSDRALSFLPLSHVLERTADYLYMLSGVTIVHVEIEEIAAALPAMRPTILVAVPRLYEKMRDRIQEKVAQAPALRRRLFGWAREVGRRVFLEPLAGGPSPSLADRMRLAIADRLVLSKVRAGIGGRVTCAVSGGAPLPRDVLDYFLTLGIPIAEGYGLTETSPVLAVNDPKAIRPGTVGPPLPGVEIRIADDGEILARGPGIMRGYFHDPESTAEALRGDWFHTGDVGDLDSRGCLRITDRKKDLIVTSGGKNVAPQLLEQALTSTGLVSQAAVFGDRRKFISALLVPNFEAVERMLRARGRAWPGAKEAVRDELVQEIFHRTVEEAMRSFARFEQVKRFALLPEAFTIESGELTPKMSIRRRIVEKKNRDLIESFYHSEADEP